MIRHNLIIVFLFLTVIFKQGYSYDDHYQFRQLIVTDQCDFKCKQCDLSTPNICTLCDDQMNRKLVGGQCICKEQFLELNQSKCSACPQDCQICTELNECDECIANKYNYKKQCYSSCPENTYLVTNSFICQDYLQYNLIEERDEYNRIILIFQFNYPLKPVANLASLIQFQIKEDPTYSSISIIPQATTSNKELKYLYLPKNSVKSTTLLVTGYNMAELVSNQNNIPLKPIQQNSPIEFTIGPYLKPKSQSTLQNLKKSSTFLYDKSSVIYDIFYVLKSFALFVHIFPALQFIMALCYMQVFKTPNFYYLIKLIGGFGINQLPDWQLYEDQSQKDKFGDDYMPFLYYIVQITIAYIFFAIFKWVYEAYKKKELDTISQFQTILKIHIWSINIVQHIHSTLFFYLVYYSVFILKNSDFSTSSGLFFFSLAIIYLIYLCIYIIVGAYRLAINSFHFYIYYVKEIDEQPLLQRFYQFGLGSGIKIIYIVALCILFSSNPIIISSIALGLYAIGLGMTIALRPYQSVSLFIVKLIEQLSQVGIFSTILAGQVLYDRSNLSLQENEDAFYSMDYACLSFIGLFLFMNIIKVITQFKHLIYKNESTKRTITYLHKYNDHYLEPLSGNRNQSLISKKQLLLDQSINNMSQSPNKQPNYLSKKSILQGSKLIQPANKMKDSDNNVQIEMNNYKSNQSQQFDSNLMSSNKNPSENIHKFQKQVQQIKLKNQVANQFQQNAQNSENQYQPNAISNYQKNNVQGKNVFKKAENGNGYALQYTLRDLYGGQNKQNFFSNKAQQMYNSKPKIKGATPGMIMEQKKMYKNSEIVDNYFNDIQKKQDPSSYDQYQSQQNKVQNYESIEKNNFQSNYPNQSFDSKNNSNSNNNNNNNQSTVNNNNIVLVNPYIQNINKNNQIGNLEFISEEDPKQFSNSLTPINNSNDFHHKNNENNFAADQIIPSQTHKNDLNYLSNNNDEEQEVNKKQNNPINKNNIQDSLNQYKGGESIDLQENNEDQLYDEKENNEYSQKNLQQSKNNNNETFNNLLQQQKLNSQDNFQVFFHNKLNDNSIQYIQEDPSESNIPSQNIGIINNQDILKKLSSEQQDGKQQIDSNYISPDFNSPSNQQIQNKYINNNNINKSSFKQQQ